MSKPLPAEFANKIEFTDSCWLFKSNINKHGYGQLRFEGKTMFAHRYSWHYFNDGIPDGLQVLHKCDVRNCVNPDHLFLGTNQENTADREAKGRTVKGETHGMARLKTEDVIYIRNSYQRGTNAEYSMTGLSKKFGVSITQISRIINNRAWSA
jgi:hypothetical protein